MHTIIALYFAHRRKGSYPALAWELACIHYLPALPRTRRA